MGHSVRQGRRGLGFHRDQCGAAVYSRLTEDEEPAAVVTQWSTTTSTPYVKNQSGSGSLESSAPGLR